MRVIETDNAPTPGGHYAQGVAHGGFLYVSGQLPIDPSSGEKRTGAVEDQTLQVLRNVLAVVEAGGSDMTRIVKTTVYVSDMDLWGRVNAVYADFFGASRPARAIVPTKDLHHGFKVEIEAVAALPEHSPS